MTIYREQYAVSILSGQGDIKVSAKILQTTKFTKNTTDNQPVENKKNILFNLFFVPSVFFVVINNEI